jgi:hypothetical protein
MTCWGSACLSSPGSTLAVRLCSQGMRPTEVPLGSGRTMARDLQDRGRL